MESEDLKEEAKYAQETEEPTDTGHLEPANIWVSRFDRRLMGEEQEILRRKDLMDRLHSAMNEAYRGTVSELTEQLIQDLLHGRNTPWTLRVSARDFDR